MGSEWKQLLTWNLKMQKVVVSQPDRAAQLGSPNSDAQSHVSDASRASVDSLPVEILLIIFVHCVHSASLPTTSPLALGRTCRRWRHIIWSTPELWTRLKMDGRHSTSRVHIKLADEWLNRSGTLPLSIHYSVYSEGTRSTEKQYGEAPNPAICRRIIEVLFRRSDRFHTVSLILPRTLLDTLGTLSHRPRALHSLSLETRREGRPHYICHSDPSIVTAFLACTPKIVNIACLDARLQWDSVTTLTIETMSAWRILRILVQAPNLSECIFKEVGSNQVYQYFFNQTTTMITSRSLKSLDIEFLDELALEFFCNSTSLPALQHLRFAATSELMPLHMRNVIELLRNSSCSLESLVINEPDIWEGNLIELGPFLSSLTRLKIPSGQPTSPEVYNDCDTFYHILSNPSQVEPRLLPSASLATESFFPALEIFECAGFTCYPWDTIPGLLEPMTRRGVLWRRPIKSVKIHCVGARDKDISYIPKDVISRLSEFQDVEFVFTVDLPQSGQFGIDWWKASLLPRRHFEVQGNTS